MKSFKVLVLLSALLGMTTVYVANIAAADGDGDIFEYDATSNGDQSDNHDTNKPDLKPNEILESHGHDSDTVSPANRAGSGRVTQIAYTNAPGSNVIVDPGTLVESQAQIAKLRAALAELQLVNRNQQVAIEKLTQENKSLVGRLKNQTKANNEIIAEVGNIEAENAQLKADNIAVRLDRDNAKKENQALKQAAEDVESAQEELKSIKAKNAELTRTHEKTTTELLKVRATIDELESKSDLTAQERERLAELEGVDAKLKEEQVRTAQLQEQLGSQEAASRQAIEALRKNHGVQVAELEEQVASGKKAIVELQEQLANVKENISGKTETSLGEETKAPDAQQKAEMTERTAELENALTEQEKANKLLQTQLAEMQQAKPPVVAAKPGPANQGPADIAQPQTVEFPNKTGAQLLDLFNAPSGVFAKALMDSGLVDRVIFLDKGGKGIVIFGPKEGQTKVKFTNEINSYAVKLLDQCTKILTKNKAKLIQPKVIDAAQNVIDLIELFEKNGYPMTEETKQRIAILKALPNAAELVIPKSLEVLSVVSGDGSHVSGKGEPAGDATQTAGKPVKKGLWQRVKEFLREHFNSNFKTLNTSYREAYKKGFAGFDKLPTQIDALMVGKTPAERASVLKQGQSLATLQRTTVIHSVMDAVLQDRLSSANKWASINQETLLSQIMASPEIQDLLKQQGEFREALRNKFIGSDPNPDTYAAQREAYGQIKVTLGLDDADVKVRVKNMLSQYEKMVSSSFVKATQAMPNPVLESGPPEDDDEYSGN